MRASESDSEKVLTGLMAEFRTALRQEIEAARRSASDRAILLVDGKRIAQMGGEFQYTFFLENALNVPSDTPGDLVVSSGEHFSVTIISISGLMVTISVAKDFGQDIPSARLVTNLTFLMEKLIKRLEDKADMSNRAGDRILTGTYDGKPHYNIEFRRVNLNAGQKEAVLSSLGQNTTFIWGPPGTGKTYTIGEIGDQLYIANRSMLVISHTNTAVDTAIVQIAEKFSEDELANGEIIRVGVTTAPKVLLRPNLLLQTHVDKKAQELARRREALDQERCLARERVTRLSRLLEIAEWVSMAELDIEAMNSKLEKIQVLENELEECGEQLRKFEQKDAHWQDAEKEVHIAEGTERKMIDLRRREGTLGGKRGEIEKELELSHVELLEAQKILAESSSVGWLTRKWRGLPSPEEQMGVVESIEVKESAKDEQVRSICAELETVQKRKEQCEEALTQFQNKYVGTPREVLDRARDHKQKKVKAIIQRDELREEHLQKLGTLSHNIRERVLSLCAFGLSEPPRETAGKMLEQICEAYEKAKKLVEGEDIEAIRREMREDNEAIVRMSAELETIEDELKRVEETIIREARVVATTLTRAYLRDSIQEREFDTVLLDEASMAPIPALWIAASLAKNNVVIVGDFKQLPPIVISEEDCAKKWLGRDIFEVAGITQNLNHPCLKTLNEQHRMRPEISMIANKLIYEGKLTDADGAGEGDKESPPLDKWYRTDWGHDTPVLLIDTECLNAWVTSVPRERGSSRLNFLSAALCIELVGQILRTDRPVHREGDEPRILLVSPYRPHAKLSELLLQKTLKGREVVAGTVHSFQGSEADVVILDLVNDEPHWRVGMFMPESNDQTRRLLNVAVTRARKRLIVVGDFKYIGKYANKNSFIRKYFLSFLLDRYPRVEALEIVKTGLAARAATAQIDMAGGYKQSEVERLITTGQNFYRFLAGDIQKARHRIVIYSAFMTQQRLSEVGPHLTAAIERGVSVYIVTKSMSERNRQEKGIYNRIEECLKKWKIKVIHKESMHEKLVFIDDNILWEGSLNVMSASQSGEHMERRVSKEIVGHYAKTIWLEELLCEYEEKTLDCPICKSEVIASEGRDEPFYWRCINDGCYTRSVGQPPIKDGIIRCYNCGKAVEYGEWGNKPAWRCVANKKHRQPLIGAHLKLPKMRAIIPKKELKKLEKLFSISGQGLEKRQEKDEKGQEYLFGL
jgi:superfamily I DNA and/or RNA helicase